MGRPEDEPVEPGVPVVIVTGCDRCGAVGPIAWCLHCMADICEPCSRVGCCGRVPASTSPFRASRPIVSRKRQVGPTKKKE